MAVEKVALVNVVGKLDYVSSFARDVFVFDDIQLLDSTSEIDSGRFTLPVTEKNIDELLGFANLVPGSNKASQKILEKKLKQINAFYQDKLDFQSSQAGQARLNADEVLQDCEAFISSLEKTAHKLEASRTAYEKVNTSLTAYSYLKEVNVPMREFADMTYFSWVLGSLTADNAQRLKSIYPSITSMIFHVGTTPEGEAVYLIITEKDFVAETDRVLKALSFKPVEGIDPAYTATPLEIITMLEQKKRTLEGEIKSEDSILKEELAQKHTQAQKLYNELYLLITINTIESYMAFSKNNFYFSAWIPARKEAQFNRLAEKYPSLIIMYETPEKSLKPPTKLSNNWLFRPFESLVKMYGVPNYNELDPTPFLALTYILCFGYMFGDVGQGIVLLLGGLFTEKKIKPLSALGGVVARISVASIIFGFLYGSFFGLEDVIPALWLRPMEDTQTLLITAIVIGVIMLLVAYVYGLINKRRMHEVEAEYFGKNGYSGLIIYISLLCLVLVMMHYVPAPKITQGILIALIVIFTILVFLALPMTNLIEKKRFNQNVKGEYYVSSFFEVFEMFLSMLSNTLSFIRVGAFALTHVGMFMAFATIAEMCGGGFAGAVILIIGNIFILALEGLIDFIQCLRLQFYELFGKYYEGNGTRFVPVKEEVALDKD